MHDDPTAWTAKRKVDLLLRLIRGDATPDAVCRDHGLSRTGLDAWMNTFLLGGEQALANRTPESARDDSASINLDSPAELRSIIDGIPVIAWRARADGTAKFVNQRYKDYTGLSDETSRDWGWADAVHPDDVARVMERWRESVATKRPTDVEARFRDRDGAYRWFLFSAAPYLDERGRFVDWCGVQIDIEDRKRVEDALRENERALHQIVESIPGMITVHGPTGDLEYVNHQLLEYVGVDVAELTGIGWARLVHPDDADEAVNAWLRALETHEPIDITFRIRHAQGGYRWFNARAAPLRGARGQIIRWHSLFWDIEDIKQGENLLREREHELRLLVDSVPGMIAVADASGMHQYANKRAMEYVGKALHEVADLRWIDDIHPDERGTVRAEWIRCVAAGVTMDLEHRWRRHDGVYRWIHVRVEPLRDHDGRVVRWYGLLVDIDDRKRAEDTVRRTQDQLAHVTRLTSVGELTASIAHEINQPLQTIVNDAYACLDLLPKGWSVTDDIPEALREMIEAAQQASGIIERVRQWAKKTTFEPIVVDLRGVVADVTALARHEAINRSVVVQTDVSDGLPLVIGDRVQLQQVLLNLMVNGMDAMSTVAPSDRLLTIRSRPEATHVLVTVSDTGIGLTSGAAGRMFEPFYTTKPDGMGMGLAISRSIVEAHGGRLWAEPNPDAGVTFVFTVPTAAPDPR